VDDKKFRRINLKGLIFLKEFFWNIFFQNIFFKIRKTNEKILRNFFLNVFEKKNDKNKNNENSSIFLEKGCKFSILKNKNLDFFQFLAFLNLKLFFCKKKSLPKALKLKFINRCFNFILSRNPLKNDRDFLNLLSGLFEFRVTYFKLLYYFFPIKKQL